LFENWNTSRNDNSLRSRVVQNREQEKAKQGKEKDEDEEDGQETPQKGCLALVIVACVLNFHRALPLFVITIVAIFFVIWDHFMAKYESQIAQFLPPGQRLLDSHWFWLKWVIWACLILGVIFWLVFDTTKLGQQQLVSFSGLIMYIILTFLFSKHPTKVYWRPVFWGIGLQFLLGLLILRTEPGFMAFDWLGKQVQTFLEYTDAGPSFVFGEKYKGHFLAFKVLPIVIFFSTVMSVLYYLGLMQQVMLVTMGTSPVESVVAFGNIFVGQTESPQLVRPYLPYAFILCGCFMWMSICPGKGGEDSKCVLTVTKLEGQAGED
ncbi:hypothetical protein E2I00_019598, partial [Balaenoptera physalus]